MPVSKEEAMTMFDYDLRVVMDNISGLLRHYQIADWESYLFFRKRSCPQSWVLKYESSAGDDFAKRIVALHAAPSDDYAAVSPDEIAIMYARKVCAVIEAVENRCAATDGPVRKTLEEITTTELSEIYMASVAICRLGRTK